MTQTFIEIVHADVIADGYDPAVCAEFAAVITDPPYSAHVHENAASVGTDGVPSGEMGTRARDLGFAPLSLELRTWIAKAAANVSRWSCIFADWQGCHRWSNAVQIAGAEDLHRWEPWVPNPPEADEASVDPVLPWIRWSQPQLSGDRPCTGSEAIMLFHSQNRGARGGLKPKRKQWNGPGNLTHFYRRALRGEYKHPTEKPLDLMLDLVCYFTDPGEAVIDPCAGAGTTAQACRLLGRSCLAIERDEEWARKAQTRVTSVLSDRDRTRAIDWAKDVEREALRVPVPSAKDGSDVKTYERAQRRLADARRLLNVG